MDMRPHDHSKQDAEPPLDHPIPLPCGDPFTPLEHLVHLLQGHAEPSIADIGITTLPSRQLDTLCVVAREEADTCQERADLLLDLLESSLESGITPTTNTQLRITHHLRLLARDQRRWHDLADNASYYRDNPGIAASIASWRQSPHGDTPAISLAHPSSRPSIQDKETQ